MAVTSNRTITITYTNDLVANEILSAGVNASSPGSITLQNLSGGANTITVPTGGSIPTAATIIPPASNTLSITLKGVTGDTGISLHLTDPTTIALASSVTTFCLTAGGTIIGLRIYWS